MKKTYRILCLVLSLIMVASLLPMSASAADSIPLILTDGRFNANWEFFSDKNCTEPITEIHVVSNRDAWNTFYMRYKTSLSTFAPNVLDIIITTDNYGSNKYTSCTIPNNNPTPDSNGVYEVKFSYFGDETVKYMQIQGPGRDKRTAMIGLVGNYLVGQNIYFGLRDNDGDSVSEVLKWNVLGDSTQDDGILLLSDTVLDNAPFDTDDVTPAGELVKEASNLWTGSNAESWCQSLITEAFTKKEQTLLINTLLDMGPYTTQPDDMNRIFSSPRLEEDMYEKLFFLSTKEVEKYLPTKEDRKLGVSWFTRTPIQGSVDVTVPRTIYVSGTGRFTASQSHLKSNYRPAMNLDLSSVIMMNAASENENPDFSAVGAYSGNDWFLTIGDSKEFYATGYTGETTFTEGYAESDVTVNHYALNNAVYHATVESIYNRVTATLTNSSGDVLYYGKINSNTSATTSTVTIPEGLPAGNYTLSIRGETWGDKPNMTRVASGTAYNIPITVKTADGYKITENEPAVQMGVGALTGYTDDYGYDYLTFGKSNLGWRVLDTKANTGEEGVFILSEDVLANNVAYNSSATDLYSASSADTWAKEFAASDNFSEGELSAILNTTKSDSADTFSFNSEELEIYYETSILSEDKAFMLSYAEATNKAYGLSDSTRRVGKYNGTNTAWWLRSTVESNLPFAKLAVLVEKNGGVKYGNVTASYTYDGTTTEYMGYRPAMNINTSQVVFTAAADGSGEVTFGKIPNVASNSWKLTLSTGDSFLTTLDKFTIIQGETITVNYSELPTGYDTVTALLLNGETPVCYGKLTPISETESTLTIPGDLEAGEYRLRIYAEDWNEGATNYIADDVYTRIITVVEHEHSWSDEYSFDDTHHWHECTVEGCGITDNSEKDSYHAHASTGINVATFITKAVCDVCGNEYGESKPYLGYTFEENYDGTLTLTGCIGDETELNIPDNVLGKPVTIIGQSALEGNENITKIALPDSIKRIEKWAFKKLSNLTEITLNDGLEYIGEGAIEMTAITSITIPNTVTEIGVWAFADNKQLSKINLGTGLEKIGYVAFRNTIASEIILPASLTEIGYDVFKGYTEDDVIYVHSNPNLGENAYGGATVVDCTDQITAQYNYTHHRIYCWRCNVVVGNEEEHKLVEGDCTGCDFYLHITTTAPEGTTTVPEETTTVPLEPTTTVETEPKESTAPSETTAPEESSTAPIEPSTAETDPKESTAPSETTAPEESSTASSETTIPQESSTAPTEPVIIGLLGDADMNGTVNIKDATVIQKHSAYISTLTDNNLLLADVNCDKVVNVKDATAIQKFVAFIETGYPIGDPLFYSDN